MTVSFSARHIRRWTTMIAIAVGSLLAADTASAAVAPDDPSALTETRVSGPVGYSCGPNGGDGLNPYTYVPADQRVRAFYSQDPRFDSKFIEVYRSQNVEYKGARIWWVWGHTMSGGDMISLDWSDDGGSSYRACHATVASGKTSVTTPAVDKAGQRKFRACIKPYGYTWLCTRWLN
ncbi:hypothetical protein [Nonomuraea sp. NPDC002799]